MTPGQWIEQGKVIFLVGRMILARLAGIGADSPNPTPTIELLLLPLLLVVVCCAEDESTTACRFGYAELQVATGFNGVIERVGVGAGSMGMCL